MHSKRGEKGEKGKVAMYLRVNALLVIAALPVLASALRAAFSF